MKEKIIKEKDFIRTKWDGGQTTQLAIYPEGANLSDKDFLWRISSATFTNFESKFSDFTGYQRYILPLKGKLSLYHQGIYDRELDEYEVDYFDASWNTSSKNTRDCIDYNFIVKSGSQGKIQILTEDDKYLVKKSMIITMFSMDAFILNIKNKDEKRYIDGYSLLVIEIEKEEIISIEKANLPVIMTEFLIK